MARLRLLTFNIAHARGAMPLHQSMFSPAKLRANLLAIAKLINRLEADIVALQEIDENSHWSGSFDHLRFLAEHTGLEHTVYGLNNRRLGRFHLNYGNAVLSRFPVHHHETVTFGKKTIGEKGFLFAEIDTPAGRLPLINVHMHHRSRPSRLRQVLHMMKFIDQQHAARHRSWRTGLLICGDFNNPSHWPDATAALLGYLEQFDNYTLLPKARRDGKAERTFPSLWPQRALDYIYLPSHCGDLTVTVVRSFLSDHRPVLVEFQLKSK
jgi:endonuclease/exonuclease/phosphatase family metal-dependent hydrolase